MACDEVVRQPFTSVRISKTRTGDLLAVLPYCSSATSRVKTLRGSYREERTSINIDLHFTDPTLFFSPSLGLALHAPVHPQPGLCSGLAVPQRTPITVDDEVTLGGDGIPFLYRQRFSGGQGGRDLAFGQSGGGVFFPYTPADDGFGIRLGSGDALPDIVESFLLRGKLFELRPSPGSSLMFSDHCRDVDDRCPPWAYSPPVALCLGFTFRPEISPDETSLSAWRILLGRSWSREMLTM